MRCERVCTDSCPRSRNGRCDDGGPNDPGPDHRPQCSLGSDCFDCGPRNLCTPHQTNLRLPMHAVERRLDAAPLAATEILFIVMGSHRYRQRSLRAHRTWCTRPQKLSCLFFSDGREGEAADPSGMPLVQVLRRLGCRAAAVADGPATHVHKLQPVHPARHPRHPPPIPRTSGESGPAASTELLPTRLPVDLLRRAPRHDAARTVPLPTRAAARRGLSNPNSLP